MNSVNLLGNFRKRIDAPTLAILLMTAIAIGLALLNPFFLRAENLENLARSSGFFVVFALAQTLAILVRGLDLSQGSLVAFISVVAAILSSSVGWQMAFIICLLIGSFHGMIQGLLIGRFGLSAFVVTLGGGSILSGSALLLSKGQTIYEVPDGYDTLGWSSLAGMPLVAILSIVLAIMVWALLNKSAIGRAIYATGSNPEAAFVIGIPIRGITLACYILGALITSAGAVFLSSRITSGSPVVGSEIALQSIAAAVVGGVSLFGGKGTVLGVASGAITLAILANLLNLYNVSSYWQPVLFGVVIIAAVIFDCLRAR